MVTIFNRSGALRSLPALLALLVALFVAPADVTASFTPGSAAGVSSSLVAPADAPVADQAEQAPPPADLPVEFLVTGPAADGARVLATQSSTRTRASRAPPASL